MTSLRTRRRLVDRLRLDGIQSETVLAAIQNTPRHLFIDQALAHKAYEDTALPIGQNQTISQPFVVALMTELLMQSSIPMNKVLEVGTGCGYQTAILSQLVKWVFTIERIGSLQQQARERLPGLGYRNISYLNGDGFEGWSSNQPFDGILVAAAPKEVPQTLLEQLAVGGRMVIPVGDGARQDLRIVTRTEGGFSEEIRNGVRFVPMLNGHKI
ncbi:MAG: protein-L-isoaspartate(D-aspartate) O-methyltransferase [Acidiferrobacterales bacterium]|nr:protein-L-isoaspartate(D-aspartate) O-methyltransferase [Acidiferrobacterales bacterium]